MQGWVFTSVSGDRSWQSNDGYADVLGSLYIYDSAVSFYKQVAEGHVIVIREAGQSWACRESTESMQRTTSSPVNVVRSAEVLESSTGSAPTSGLAQM